ncbi:hypothetical protein CKO38_10795 [Rhodospirillum rubrum]|uniref:hypothetical protein n=1 Tax=Rhodospirillum rubrum TaxID=1085 RepID=UPI0019031474|nr:hypothetical protein [Rhodospirillum rubrum]MBK1666275.1 hypothetical protein [Rhodospirillum rubrum]MBK1677142.1 hypothetical protein [Rhodospirillum rubrum]
MTAEAHGKDDWQTALRVMAAAGTWEEMRGDLERLGVLGRLDGAQRLDLARLWERRGVEALDDRRLAEDLRHWAAGLGPTDHPLGFLAPRPAALAAEAARRGWFQRPLPGGRTLINPPDGKPVLLPPGPEGG